MDGVKVRMARFAMHKIRLRDYGMGVLRGEITAEQAAEEYKRAMENFDQIIELAETEPDRLIACEEDMSKGFRLP